MERVSEQQGSDVAPRAALLLVVALAFVPGFGGAWGRDDFAQLAYMRLIGSPWPLFAHDHFFAAGSVFRPLGFASMWLDTALFGSGYAGHALAGLALHLGVALALYGLMRTTGIGRWIAAACAALFAAHPVAIGTALWWSARFDELAILFALLALRAAVAQEARGGWRSLGACALAMLAAALSKETGLAAIGAVCAYALLLGARDRAARHAAAGLLASCVAVALGYFAWRWLVLGTAGSRLSDGQAPLGLALWKGLGDWTHYAAGYASYWARLGGAQRLLVAAAPIVLATVLARPVTEHARGGPSGDGRRAGPRDLHPLALGAASLMLLPAFLQAPVVAMNGAALGFAGSALEAAMQSRLYDLGLAGAALLLATLLAHRARGRARGVGFALALAIAGFASAGYATARDCAERSAAIASPAYAAAAAVEALDLPREHCHVFVLGVAPPPEWGVFVSMDSVVKALAADPARLRHCFIHSDYKTIFYVTARGTGPDDAYPFAPRESRRGAIPWLEIGDVTLAYLRYQPERVLPDPAGMTFLRYENGAFRDVGADVAAGRLEVRMN